MIVYVGVLCFHSGVVVVVATGVEGSVIPVNEKLITELTLSCFTLQRTWLFIKYTVLMNYLSTIPTVWLNV